MTTPMHAGLETIDKNFPDILLHISTTNMSGQECVCSDMSDYVWTISMLYQALYVWPLEKYCGCVVTM